MKRILVTLLALSMVLSLVGCGGKVTQDPSVEPNPPIGNPSQTIVETPSNSEPDAIIPDYNDDNVIVYVDGEDVVFIGNASMDWKVDSYDDGVSVTQNDETIVITPIADTEATTTIICENVVMYFVTVTKQPAQQPTVFVEKFNLEPPEKADSGYEDIESMMDYIYTTVPEGSVPMNVINSALPINDEDMCIYALGVASLKGLEYAAISDPAMTSIAYSLAILKFDTNDNAQNAIEILKDNAPMNKWVCVVADDVSARVVNDTYVIFTMGSQEAVSEIDAVDFSNYVVSYN